MITMKTIILTFIACSFTFIGFAQDRLIEAESEIQEVRVFSSGAQVSRTAIVDLEKGNTRLVLVGLTEKLQPATIRLSAPNDVSILSVTHKKRLISNAKKVPIIGMLEDSIEIVNFQLAEFKYQLEVIDAQLKLLNTNQNLKGEKGVNLIDLEDALVLYQKQMTQLKKRELDIRNAEKKLKDRQQLLVKQLNEFKKSNAQPSYEVVVSLSSPVKLKAQSFELSYFVGHATWQASYDIRVKSLDKPVTLVYKAEVYNNTGENWDDVKLRLSSGNPNLSGQAPNFNPQFISLSDPEAIKYRQKNSLQPQQMQLNEVVISKSNSSGYGDKREDTNLEDRLTSVDFDLPGKAQVLANNQPQMLNIMQKELSSNYMHVSLPKYEAAAFLTAYVKGWESINLLPGNTNLYLDEAYMGNAYINPELTSDSMPFSLGRDRGIVVQRERVKEMSSKTFSGSKAKELFVYEIKVRNMKGSTVTLLLNDALPVSTNKELQVDIKELDGAQLEAESGKLTWNLQLAPGESKTIRFSFELRYPKDKILNGYW